MGRVRHFKILIAGASLLLFVGFQNCGMKMGGFQARGHSVFQAAGNGEPIDGKTYSNYGECATDKIELKTVIHQSADGIWTKTRDNCADLASAQPVDSAALHISLQDPAVFSTSETVFDLQQSTPAQTKLTTAYCFADTEKLEVMVWYNSTALTDYPDPRLADQLFAHVLTGTGQSLGTLNVAKPVIFTDKLIYRSKDPAPQFELTEFRDGLNSSVTYRDASGSPKTVPVTCRAQAAPHYLESNTAYYLKMAPGFSPLASSTAEYAIVSHSKNNGADVFKMADYGNSVVTWSSNVGWEAGYLGIGGVIYQMRKTSEGKICFAPAADPRLPCMIWVIGQFNDDQFNSLTQATRLAAVDYEANIRAVSALAALESKDRRALARSIFVGAQLLPYLTVRSNARDLRDAIALGAGVLVAGLVPAVTNPVTNDDAVEASLIVEALRYAYEIGGDESIPSALKALPPPKAFVRNQPMANAFLLPVRIELSRLGVGSLTPADAGMVLGEMAPKQIRSLEQSKCPNSILEYGNWPALTVVAQCNPARQLAAHEMRALNSAHALFYEKKTCSDPGEWKVACENVKGMVQGALAFVYNHRKIAPEEQTGIHSIIQFEGLLASVQETGLKNKDSLPVGFKGETATVLEVKKATLEFNDLYLGPTLRNVMVLSILQARIADLLAD